MQKRTEEKRSEVIKLYSQGIPLTKVTGILGMSNETVKEILVQAGIYRTQSEQQFLMNGSALLRHDAFDILTPEALYWIGFIYADGHIHNKKGRHMITLDISTSDRKHLEKFKRFLQAAVSVRDYIRKRDDKEYKTSMISISSKPIFNRLTSLDFTSNKTYDATVHADLVSSQHFWRGLFDGDGWISKTHTRQYQYVWVGLCGTKDTVQCFIDFIKANNIETEVTQARFKKGTRNNYETAFVNKVGQKVLNLLYKESTVYLDRKYQKFLEITQSSEPIN